jgi:hypothetical protein
MAHCDDRLYVKGFFQKANFAVFDDLHGVFHAWAIAPPGLFKALRA